ncbi:MAG: cobalamin biosynthesis protein, partial [Selenomonas bovis]|nr:cobalamin biosynthesis protein [Selenomonas bovis]
MKIAILAFLIDAIIGDPQSRFHPVVLIGKLISGFERLLYRKEDSDARKFACGALLV